MPDSRDQIPETRSRAILAPGIRGPTSGLAIISLDDSLPSRSSGYAVCHVSTVAPYHYLGLHRVGFASIPSCERTL